VLNVLGLRAEDLLPVAGASQAAIGDGALNGVLVSASSSPGSQSEPVEVPLRMVGTWQGRVVAQSIDALRRQALAERSDVQAFRANVRAAQFGTRLAEAQRTRDVVVGAEYQRVGNDQAVGVTTQVPLFVYNNQKAGIGQAGALEQAARAQLRQAEIQAITDVDKAYQAYLGARQLLALYTDATLQQAEDVRSITAYTYQAGAIGLLDLLDTERTTRQVRMAYNQARAAYDVAVFQLEQAIGGPLP